MSSLRFDKCVDAVLFIITSAFVIGFGYSVFLGHPILSVISGFFGIISFVILCVWTIASAKAL